MSTTKIFLLGAATGIVAGAFAIIGFSVYVSNPKKSKMETLKDDLSAAVGEENYEKAAMLRDEIKMLSTN